MEDKLQVPATADIIWTGTPQPGFSITMLENRAERETITWGAGMFPFVLVAVAANAILFFMNGMIWTMILIIIIGVAIIVRPEIKKAERKKHTAYYITNQGVFFKLWRSRQEVIEFVPFNSIEKIYPETYKSGKGNIYLFIKKDQATFTTYDFNTCKDLLHPTLVMIENAKEVTKLLREKIELLDKTDNKIT